MQANKIERKKINFYLKFEWLFSGFGEKFSHDDLLVNLMNEILCYQIPRKKWGPGQLPILPCLSSGAECNYQLCSQFIFRPTITRGYAFTKTLRCCCTLFRNYWCIENS